MSWWLGGTLLCGAENPGTAAATGEQERQFTNSAPYSSAQEIARHFGYTVPLPAYDLKLEKFRIIVPEAEGTNRSWGLLVWISPENEARVGEDLRAQLAAHRMLLVCAYKSGNDRHPLDRFRLALDATCNMCRMYRVDPKRIYVGGFSGGSRIASMLAVAYGDLFDGTLCFCGVNYYRPVRDAQGQEYPGTYDPDPGALARARMAGRFVLVTGENDPNRLNTKFLAENGFKRDGFKNVLYVEVPGMGHALPGATVLKQTFDFLEKIPSPSMQR